MRLVVIGCFSQELETIIDCPRLPISARNCLGAEWPRAVAFAVAPASRCISATNNSHGMSRASACSCEQALQFKLRSKLHLSAVVQLQRIAQFSLSNSRIWCYVGNNFWANENLVLNLRRHGSFHGNQNNLSGLMSSSKESPFRNPGV